MAADEQLSYLCSRGVAADNSDAGCDVEEEGGRFKASPLISRLTDVPLSARAVLLSCRNQPRRLVSSLLVSSLLLSAGHNGSRQDSQETVPTLPAPSL